MKMIVRSFLALFLVGGSCAIAQDEAANPPAAADETTVSVKEKPKGKSGKDFKNNLFWGGYISLSFGNYSVIGIEPMIGYNWNPKLATGVKVRYDYIRDERYAETRTTSSYGGSIFARYRLNQKFYLQLEPATYNYELFYVGGGSEREWVPYVFAGGGFRQPLSERSWAYVELMFDVLQNDKSPYDDWTPFFSIGIGAGF